MENAPQWAGDLLTILADQFTFQFSELNAKLDNLEQGASKQSVSDLSAKVETLSLENKALKTQVETLELKFETLNRKVVSQELYSRKGQNVEFHGIKEIPDEGVNYCVTQVKSTIRKMGLDPELIPIVRCHRQPRVKPHGYTGTRPVLVRFALETDKNKVWENKYKLKGSQIYLSENYPEEVETSRKKFYPVLKQARDNPDYKGKVFLNDDKLVIKKDGNRTEFRVEDITDLPQEIHPSLLATKSDGKVTAFFGQASELSNHHRCNFVLDNTKFTSVEQYFFYNLANIDGDEVAMYKILATHDPVKQLHIGKRLKKSPKHNAARWQQEAPEVMYRAVKAKFSSDDHLKSVLLTTGDQNLIEANKHDTYWGVGLSLSDPNLLKPQFWRGENQLGNILVKVREELK